MTKLVVHRLKRLDPRVGGPILEEIAPFRTSIREAGILEWLPIEVHIALANALARHLSSSDAAGFWREMILHAFDQPLLKALVRGGLGIYGNTPKSLARFAPQSWSISMRDCGAVEATIKEDEARMRFVGVPSVLCQSPGQRYYWEGGLSTIYAYFGKQGSVVRAWDAEHEGVPVYVVRWPS